MIVYFYKWKIKQGREEDFIEAWKYVTSELRDKANSLGSRLHKGSDGFWYGYAQWPDIETRNTASVNHSEMEQARLKMRDSIEESYPDTILEPVSDYLIKD